MTVLLVALGAALGAAVRFLVSWRWPGRAATLAVNVAGSALLGGLVGASRTAELLVGVGFCGALTTFSTFAVEVVETRSWRYAAATGVLCVGAAALTRCATG